MWDDFPLPQTPGGSDCWQWYLRLVTPMVFTGGKPVRGPRSNSQIFQAQCEAFTHFTVKIFLKKMHHEGNNDSVFQ